MLPKDKFVALIVHLIYLYNVLYYYNIALIGDNSNRTTSKNYFIFIFIYIYIESGEGERSTFS